MKHYMWALLIFAPLSLADVLFQTGFEPNAPPYVVGALCDISTGQNGWFFCYSPLGASNIETATVFAGTQALQLFGSIATASHSFTLTQVGTVTFEGRILVASTVVSNPAISVRLVGAVEIDVSPGTATAANATLKSANTLSAIGPTIGTLPLSYGVWHDITLSINFANSTVYRIPGWGITGDQGIAGRYDGGK